MCCSPFSDSPFISFLLVSCVSAHVGPYFSDQVAPLWEALAESVPFIALIWKEVSAGLWHYLILTYLSHETHQPHFHYFVPGAKHTWVPDVLSTSGAAGEAAVPGGL